MATNESFVATVRAAVVGADVDRRRDGDDRRRPSSTPPCSRAGLADGPPLPVEFDPATREVVAPTSGMIDDPINASNGNMIHHELDVEFPAIAAALNIERTWNSLLASYAGRVRRRLVVGARRAPSRWPTDRVVASLADGNVVAFVPWGDGWAAPGVPRLRLVAGDEPAGCCRPTPSGASCSTATVR